MSLALYRKHRPERFSNVIGQEHIVTVLKKAVEEKTLSHAYLFSGSRGTGKTTMARIVARELGIAPEDTYEIDAASYTGVDNIRELREAAYVLPLVSPKKVYIIDEVHMLSKGAFNALLKILEEPPSHVHFILATTELRKVPDTILSRCQHFQFKKPILETLTKYAVKIAKDEGYKLNLEAANLISILGDGVYRDTLTILEQVKTSVTGKEQITRTDVEKITGAPKAELVFSLTEAILTPDLDKSLSIIREAVLKEQDLKVFLKLTISMIRNTLLLSISPRTRKYLEEEIGKEECDRLEKLGGVYNARKIMPQVLRELLLAYEEMNSSPIPELPLELALIRSLEMGAKP
jgi:DNA polymerase-3 subunit gamma/tau